VTTSGPTPTTSAFSPRFQNDPGLKPEKSKLRMDVLVIDRAESVPAAN